MSVADNSSATARTIVGAVIVGIAVVGGSYLVSSSLDSMAEQLDGVRADVADLKTALRTAAPARAAPPRARRGPDPNVRHTLNTAGAPVRGAKTARVTIVEIADFQ